MFFHILKQLEEAESLLLELGASGVDLTAKIESIQHILNPETANALTKVSHAVKLPPDFFSESEIEDLEVLMAETVSALTKQAFKKSSDELGEYFRQTIDPEPSIFQRMKIFFAIDPAAQSRKMEPSKLILINLLKRQSLSCDSCNSLSTPILDTENRYKCTKCARQFISAKHDIRHAVLDCFKNDFAAQRFILKYYDECVKRITDQA
ncbi:hypothetical protein PSYJA_01334 [Pseudomonas syringae pv. japonica str. M301072]|uniref:Uncharacterized protein n=1 Tax=Pseudomonas syringae pv. japonica str. M301072 TaxID=629262 RepID=F3FBZ8_PSESX|nr:hypothetical protein PSYJA_01334 [Pseudomonas syringae pv. japonica str. M301072]